MKPISDKLQNYTDRYSLWKEENRLTRIKMSSFNVKNMVAVPGRSSIGVKNVNIPNRGHDQIFWRKIKSINFIDQKPFFQII